ncbi:translation initiation factor IF-2 [Natribacillus halophilus]|uniref:Translation initiation factor IF-2 n=1 Tax=Natribacillus halophilus TaxID=549003 RepID=A0A1G8PPY3_9BACI|nr:translation initiation factor IF-2 [Natribacillus halophilus]SDI94609.1 bacterial translation initiation factor 2 (bIF-2) [Natribacillus halophilus]
MPKMRVYEYARSVNRPSKDVVADLKAKNIAVSNHMSVIDDEQIAQLEQAQPAKKQEERPGGNRQTKQSKPKQGNEASRPQNNNQKTNQGNKAQGNKQRGKKNNAQQRSQQRGGNHGPGRRGKSNKNQKRRTKEAPKMPEKITFAGSLTVAELAEKLTKSTSEIIKKLMGLGVMATKNEELDKTSIELIAHDFGVEVEEEEVIDELDIERYEEADDPEDLQERAPVVTIMGHVDHGKTTLLDGIRKTKVTDTEAGGITQHIGAYQVEEDGKRVTFLDTPGHAAFTTMRARGAQATDITILVVAADDGVMPQTVEALNHAKAAEVPIIVAVNKTDKENANPDRVMQELTEYELVPEAWGGDTIFVNVSAVNGGGIDELLEMILLVAEIEELKANPSKRAQGTVVEAELDRGRGPVATLLVQGGTLKVGDPIVVGYTYGRVRAMMSDVGLRVTEAGPSTPVEVTGLNGVPQAGDQFLVFADEKKAKQIGEGRAIRAKEAQRKQTSRVSLDDLYNQIQEGEIKEINLIIKADVQGSVEAVRGSLEKIDVAGVKVNVIHTGVGAVTESDVILASASNAIIIGFNVRPGTNAKQTAESENVDVRLYRVIYNAIEEIEAAMKGLLDPEYEEKVIGHVEVRQTFKVSRIGTIAGSYVTDGKITRNANARVMRDGVVIYDGTIADLKRFKDDVREVSNNYECGITLAKFNDVQEGDTIEAYVMEEVPRT